MVFQEPLLFDTTVFENVASGLKIRGVKWQDIRRIAMEQLDRFGIGHRSAFSSPLLLYIPPVEIAYHSTFKGERGATGADH